MQIGCSGLEYQRRHVEFGETDPGRAGRENVEFRDKNLENVMSPGAHPPADIVICFALLYNLEIPLAFCAALGN